MPEQDWLKVYNASHLLEAHNLKGMLQAMGIEVSLKGEELVAGAGELPPQETEVALWVEAADFTRARDALAAFESPMGAPWFCIGCGEQNEASFEFCWHCQRCPDDKTP
ncbi:MAG: DUF2007 domain-containing protein [Oceanospirillum sp.]|nr:DUF2007 domain-containing protein [Oceanospirillum sp.]